jgi:hypothetical protein
VAPGRTPASGPADGVTNLKIGGRRSSLGAEYEILVDSQLELGGRRSVGGQR